MIALTHAYLALVQAGIAQAEGDGGASPFPNFFLIVMVIAVFWFIVISPQRKEQKERDSMRENLKKGDEVVTTGGLHGQIASLDKTTITVKVAPKTDIVFDRSSISRKIVPTGESSGK